MFRWLPSLVVGGLVLAQGASATTYDVPGDFATLALAVADAGVAAGDTIRIADGTYEVDIATVDKALTFMGTTPGSTILTGNGQHRIFSSVTADITLVDLVFENAGSSAMIAPASFEGGVMRVEASHTLVIDNCVFRNNKAGRGAAVMSYGDVIVRNSTFENNSNGHEYPLPDIYGGGLLAWNETHVIAENCVFRHNRAGSGGGLGALGSAEIRGCEFDDNFGHHAGGGLWVTGNVGINEVLIEDCIFTDNWSSEGAGVSVATKTTMIVRRCTFERNVGGQVGGGIAGGKDGPLIIEECDFIDNDAVGQGGPAIFVGFITHGAQIRDCYFKGNEVTKLLSGNGGGALWLLENSNNADITVEDCTFVQNTAVRGSVAAIQDTGNGPFFPRFERCIMAYNTGSLYWCSLPNPQGSVATVKTDCTITFDNSPSDAVCGVVGPDFIHLGPDDPQVFCDASYSSICSNSTAATRGCGEMGGVPLCGKCATPTAKMSWGEVKARFHAPARSDGSDAPVKGSR